MRRLAVLLLSAGLTLAGCTGGSDAVDVTNGGQFRFVEATPRGEVIAVDDRASAPTFTGELLDGSAFDSADLAGRPVLLNFWASWCSPCRVEAPELQELHEELGEDVAFVGINVKNELQLAQAFAADVGLTFPSVFDPRGEVGLIFQNFPPSSIPATILIDREGRVAAVYLAAVEQETLHGVLTELAAES